MNLCNNHYHRESKVAKLSDIVGKLLEESLVNSL